MRRREFNVPASESLAMRTLALTLETQGPLKWVETPLGGHYKVKPNKAVKAVTPMSGKELRRIERLTHSGPDERPRYQRLLNSKQWRQLRAWYLNEHPLCERCQAKGLVRAAVDVHHKVPIESGMSDREMEELAFNRHNLQALCIPCHVMVHKEAGKNKRENVKERKQINLQRWIERHSRNAGGQYQTPADDTRSATGAEQGPTAKGRDC